MATIPIAGERNGDRPHPEAESSDSPQSVVPTLKRPREAGAYDGADDAKRGKTEVSDSLAALYICPLTKELLVDPVTAGDGHVYERWAIEQRIQTRGQRMKSPVTNKPMGSRLTDAVVVRDSIRVLVDNGTIDGELAKQWKERMKGWSMTEKTRKKAEEGNVKAMFNLGVWFQSGAKGLKKDDKLAYQWYKRAAEQHQDPICMSSAGTMLIFGQGVRKNITEGMVLITTAACMGVDVAAYHLGLYYYKGEHGLSENSLLAKHWFTKAVDGSCNIKRMTGENFKLAAECLREINNS